MIGPLVRPLRREVAVRLFCLPYAGGSAAVFRDWACRLPAAVEVVPLELRGRGARSGQSPLEQLVPIIEEMTAILLQVAGEPFALFGHSMGAVIAFEIAHALELRGFTIGRLFISAHRAPHLGPPGLGVHRLPDSSLLSQLRRLDGIPAALLADKEFMSLVLPIIRADLTACETYQYAPRSPLNCPIVAFGGWDDPLVKWEDLAEWRRYTSSSFRCDMFHAGHFFVHECMPSLLALIAADLAELAAAQRG